MNRFKNDLLVQFSVVGLVILAAIGVILGYAISHKVRSDAVDNLVEEAVGASSGRLLTAITSADLEVPMTGERYDRFHEFVQQSIVSQRTARVKLWSKDGTVIYSTDPAGVGKQFPSKPSLLKALRGENAIEIKIPKDPENEQDRFLDTLMEVYTPIVFPGSTQPQGAFEIYQYYQPTAQRINEMRWWIFGSLGGGFLALYASLIFIVGGGWKTITNQRQQLESVNTELMESVENVGRSNELLLAEIAERKKAEDELKNSHAELESRVQDRTAELMGSLCEKEVPLKEINHRVKNNLQIVSSLLNLQSRDIQGDQALHSFQVSQDRIKAMALVHEMLYQSDDLARIDFGEYIKSLAADLGSSYGLDSRNIDLNIYVEDILLGVDAAIPCGVIVNELVANSLKHAFPGDRSGEIGISFREVGGQYTMTFKDDGIGLPEDLEIGNPSSLGLNIVEALTGQLGGTIDLGRNGGTEIKVTFPANMERG